MNSNLKKQIVGAALGLIGFALIWYNSSAWLAFGVFIILWGNNLEQNSMRKP